MLSGPGWRRVGRGLYCSSDLEDDPWKVLAGWRRLLPEDAVFSGRSAAWLHRLDLDPLTPVEVTVGPNSGARSRPGVKVRRAVIYAADVVPVRGLAATAMLCTLADLCSRRDKIEALIALDSALRQQLVEKPNLMNAGAASMRRLAALAEPAESPMETRLRWLLIRSGLPRPEVQTDLHDAEERFVGRADLYYRRQRLVVEFDGGNHRERLVEDDRRQNLILNAGFRMLRFTASDIHQRPDTVVGQVRHALSAAAGVSATRPAAAPR